jgi:malate/lactate dehydrogenase
MQLEEQGLTIPPHGPATIRHGKYFGRPAQIQQQGVRQQHEINLDETHRTVRLNARG